MLTPGAILLVVGSIFGLLFVAIVPPGFNADEPNHFFRALQIADGQWFGHPVDHDDFSDMVPRPAESYGGTVPISAGKLFAAAHTFPIADPMGGPARTGSIDWTAMWRIPTRSDTMTVGMSNVEVYSPLVYVPTVISYWIGKAFDLPIVVVFYLARLLNLATALSLTYAAIRLIPRGKWIILMLGLLPTSINQFSAVSADPVTIGLCFLAVALTLRAALQNAPVRIAQWLALLAVFTAIGFSKPAYIVIIGTMVAIPLCNPHVRRPRALAWWFGVALLGGFAGLWWQHLTGSIPPSFQSLGKVHAQYAFLVHNPAKTLLTLFYTFLTDLGPGRFYLPSFFGASVWNRVFLSTPLIYAMCGALMLAPLVREPTESDWQGNRATRAALSGGLTVLFGLGSAIVAVGLYAVWTAPQQTAVTGMQGRYFIPFAPLLLLALVPMRARLEEIQVRLRILTLGIAMASLTSMVWLTWRYLWRSPLPDHWS